MPDVSICIVNWNGADWLRNCLASIYGCDTRASYEVIVVDNASIANQVGPMDERFSMSWEELDGCRRARQQGWKVYFTPEAQIVHYGGRSVSLQSAALGVIYRRSLVAYFRKYHGRTANAVVRLLAVVETTLRLLCWAPSSLIRPQTRAHAFYKIGLYWATWRWLVLSQATEPSRLRGKV